MLEILWIIYLMESEKLIDNNGIYIGDFVNGISRNG